MGRNRWHDFYIGKEGGSTAGESGAEGLYGDALAWRNGRLLKGRPSPLRKALQAFKNDAIDVGSAMSGGGTMWNITAGSFYADAEQALYDVLTHSGRAPRRKVSDAAQAVARLRRGATKVEADRAEDRRHALAAAGRLEVDFRMIVRKAAHLPRRDSDVVLEFCRTVAAGAAEQSGSE